MASEQETTSAAPAGDGQRKEQGGLHMPRLPLPGMPVGMPTGTAGRVLWWGGLAALAAIEVVDWPVAVLIGAGSWVTEQYAKASAAEQFVKAAQGQRAEQSQAASHVPSQA